MGHVSLFNSRNFTCINNTALVILDDPAAIVFFGFLCSKHDYWESMGLLTPDGYFFCTQENLHADTRVKIRAQLLICRDLERRGWLKTKSMGIPKKKYYKIIIEKAMQDIEKFELYKKRDSCVHDSAKLLSREPTINYIRETKSEKKIPSKHTTPKSKAPSVERFFLDQLDEDDFAFCHEAMKKIRELRAEYSNCQHLYDGPMTLDEWSRAESAMLDSNIEIERIQAAIDAAITSRYLTDTYVKSDTKINLCFIVHGYDDQRSEDRFEKVAGCF